MKGIIDYRKIYFNSSILERAFKTIDLHSLTDNEYKQIRHDLLKVSFLIDGYGFRELADLVKYISLIDQILPSCTFKQLQLLTYILLSIYDGLIDVNTIVDDLLRFVKQFNEGTIKDAYDLVKYQIAKQTFVEKYQEHDKNSLLLNIPEDVKQSYDKYREALKDINIESISFENYKRCTKLMEYVGNYITFKHRSIVPAVKHFLYKRKPYYNLSTVSSVSSLIALIISADISIDKFMFDYNVITHFMSLIYALGISDINCYTICKDINKYFIDTNIIQLSEDGKKLFEDYMNFTFSVSPIKPFVKDCLTCLQKELPKDLIKHTKVRKCKNRSEKELNELVDTILKSIKYKP